MTHGIECSVGSPEASNNIAWRSETLMQGKIDCHPPDSSALRGSLRTVKDGRMSSELGKSSRNRGQNHRRLNHEVEVVEGKSQSE